MIKTIIIVPILLAIYILVTLTGCTTSDTESDNIKTSGFYTVFIVTKNLPDNKIEAEACITVDNELGTEIELNNGEKIECNGVRLVRQFHIIKYIYMATFDSSDSNFAFTLFRNGESPYVTQAPPMPESPQITSVAQGQSNSLIINWSNSTGSGSNVEISVKSDYLINSYSNYPVPDTGTYTIDNIEFFNNAPNYDLKVSIARSSPKLPVNPAFDGGYIESKIVDTRDYTFDVTP